MIKNIVTNTILCLSLVFVLSATVSCAYTGAPGSQWILAKNEDLKPGTILTPGPSQEAAPVEVSKLPPALKNFAEKAFPNTPILLVTTSEHLKDPSPAIPDDPVTPENEAKPAGPAPAVVPITPPTSADGSIDFETWAGQAIPAIGSVVPPGVGSWLPLAGLILGALSKKRSRQHLGEVVSNLNPLDGGTVDVGGAWGSFKKGIGWEHSLQTPAELRALADKLEAQKVADAKLEAATKKVG